jgi:hypothetical protein
MSTRIYTQHAHFSLSITASLTLVDRATLLDLTKFSECQFMCKKVPINIKIDHMQNLGKILTAI